MSPRSLPNRRGFVVLNYLSVAANAPLVSPEPDGRYRPRSDGEAAMACVDAADTALRLMIDTAAEGQGKWIRRFYKQWTVDNGPAVLVLVANGLATLMAHMRPESAAAQTAAQRRLADAFGEADTAFFDELVEDIDAATGAGLLHAHVDLAFMAAKMVMGDKAASMPGFVGSSSEAFGDQFIAQTTWQLCVNHAATAWLRATDPERLPAAG